MVGTLRQGPNVLLSPQHGGDRKCSLTIADLTILDSPNWNFNLRGANILVEQVRSLANVGECEGYGSAPNTDGCNVGGVNITVRDLVVHNGDDCVPVTSQSAPGKTTSNVSVSNIQCACGTNGGVVYNSDGIVEHVSFRNMTVVGTDAGAGIKIGRPGQNSVGGIVRNISWLVSHSPILISSVLLLTNYDTPHPFYFSRQHMPSTKVHAIYISLSLPRSGSDSFLMYCTVLECSGKESQSYLHGVSPSTQTFIPKMRWPTPLVVSPAKPQRHQVGSQHTISLMATSRPNSARRHYTQVRSRPIPPPLIPSPRPLPPSLRIFSLFLKLSVSTLVCSASRLLFVRSRQSM